MTYQRKEVIGNCTLYLGDCREILPTLGEVDAVVTDPPYGLGSKLDGGSGEWGVMYSDGAPEWDREIHPSVVGLVGIADEVVIWGGNYYPLPPKRGWLVWDKMQKHSSGHCELAWSNIDQPTRTYRYARAQLASEGKRHPTQKPLGLMEWSLSFLPTAETVLDRFMGSGTTGVACAKMGRSFIGIEIDEGYFEIACERIRAAYAQPDMFVEAQ